MNIFAIADLHFDDKNEKPMDIFGDNWGDHESKIMKNWIETVGKDDIVLVPGDISWAVKLEDAVMDLSKIDELPGHKILGRGNHDYWWSTSNKLDALSMKSIKFLKNNSYEFDDFILCGTRGWDSIDENSQASDEKIYNRELSRFKISLERFKHVSKRKIAMLHFPPFNNDGGVNEFVYMMQDYGIDTCLYGHLHGEEGHKLIREGMIGGMMFHCVASDYLDFKLKKIE